MRSIWSTQHKILKRGQEVMKVSCRRTALCCAANVGKNGQYFAICAKLSLDQKIPKQNKRCALILRSFWATQREILKGFNILDPQKMCCCCCCCLLNSNPPGNPTVSLAYWSLDQSARQPDPKSAEVRRCIPHGARDTRLQEKLEDGKIFRLKSCPVFG